MDNALELSKKYFSLNENDLKKEDIYVLRKLINYHSDLYHNKQMPIISDYEYDILLKKLEYLESKFLGEGEQTTLVGADIVESSFQKVRHERPMISLDNTYNEEELRDFDTRVKKILKLSDDVKIEYALEYKFDGLGIELIYHNGEFTQAITRGNGIEGEDVTENVRGIKNIPKNIPYKESFGIRGEIVMPLSVFEKLNKEAIATGKKVFSNPRNAASGSIRTKDINVTCSRELRFYSYDLANLEEYREHTGIKTYYDVIKSFLKLSFETSSYFIICSGIEEIINAIKNFPNNKNKIDYDVDGLVIKMNNMDEWEQVGWTEHHPRYAIAYKFPAEILTTKIIGVEHNVGRTGTITPTAILEPINIGGVIVKRATLHNYEEVANLDVRIGDTIFIKRAGEVIPKIISVVETKGREKLEKITPPEFCPSCRTRIKKDEDKVRYYCPNTIDCPSRHIEKLIFAVGKSGLNIDSLGEKQIELFWSLGFVRTLADIFRLKDKKEDMLTLPGYKEKSVNNLLETIEKAREQDITSFLTALGIAGVGKKTAKTISVLFKSQDDLLNFPYSQEDLEDLADVGPEIAKNIIEYFNNDAHKRLLEDISEVINIKYYEKKEILSNSVFTGKKICITGGFELNGIKINRDELVEKLEKVGGEFVGSVSKNTDYLLNGENAGSKLAKAKELGVKIISLDYFLSNL